jgi:hypothetical protein
MQVDPPEDSDAIEKFEELRTLFGEQLVIRGS